MDISVKVATQTTGSPHKLWAEFDVDRTTVSIPGQSEALLLGHHNIAGDLLQLQVMDVVGQFKTGYNKTEQRMKIPKIRLMLLYMRQMMKSSTLRLILL